MEADPTNEPYDGSIEMSDAQILVLQITFFVASLVSLVSSAFLIWWILTEGRVRRSSRRQNYTQLLDPQRRFLLAMAGFDILNSLNGAVSAFPTFNEPSPICTAIGFVYVVCVAIPCYNCFLALYYLLLIRSNISPRRFAQRYELFCHLVAVGVPLLISFAILGVKGFNPSTEPLTCSLATYPLFCTDHDDVVCERGESLWIIFTYVLIPIVCIFFVFLLFNNITMVYYVFRTERQSGRWRWSTPNAASTTRTTSSSLRVNNNDNYYQRTRKVAIQSFLYVSAFFLCYTWSFVRVIIPAEEQSLWLIFLDNTLYSLQGLFNLLIYLRPQRAAVKENFMQRIQKGGNINHNNNNAIQEGPAPPPELADRDDITNHTPTMSTSHAGIVPPNEQNESCHEDATVEPNATDV